MKTYNYFYDNQPVLKSEFLSNVPEKWELDIKDGEYLYGYYHAIEREN